MAIRRLITLLALGCCLSTGCTLVSDATHVAGQRSFESMRECLERQRNRHWAEEVWQKESVGADYSVHFAKGFKTGFAEHLYRGGNGEPPVLPPDHYRALKYQTPEGQQQIFDWFAGYRRGAAVAQHSGFRQLVTGSTSLQPYALDAAPLLHDAGSPPAAPVPAPLEVLPVPQEKRMPSSENGQAAYPLEILPAAKVQRINTPDNSESHRPRASKEEPVRVVRIPAPKTVPQEEAPKGDGPVLPQSSSEGAVTQVRPAAAKNVAPELPETRRVESSSPQVQLIPLPLASGTDDAKLGTPRKEKCWNP